MTTVSVDKDLLEELIDLKMHYLLDEIDKILNNWCYKSPDKFLQDAKDGTIEEAEDDAITLKQLVAQREELLILKKKWND
ncbi:hypothetical protein LCGC14_1100120 [marine sediment metagenome]|uniref:Uncharacterized protein n=1 Tax=marine sediment metagenome TaxID=412755 RepID=A0A0F9MEA2_9ZZZZ